MIHQMLAIWLGFSTFSKFNLYLWEFSGHVLLKRSLKAFEHNLTSIWNEYSCMAVWTFFGIVFLWDWNINWTFLVLWILLSFPNLLIYWVQYFNSSIFLIKKKKKKSAGIPSPPLALFVVIPPKVHMISHSRMSGHKVIVYMRAQSCLTFCDPMDCSPSASFVHGIFQARILERVAISFSREYSWPRDWTHLLHWQLGTLPGESPCKPHKVINWKRIINRKNIFPTRVMFLQRWNKWLQMYSTAK